MSHVWYLSYGSNMLRERFMCYINGTVFKGNGYKEDGCHDKSKPIDDRNIRIKNDLYFAKSSPRWSNMGVAFITEKQGQSEDTFARMYLITKEQFEDVVKQENRIDVESNLNINYKELHENGSSLLFKDKFYGKLLYVGEMKGQPIYTFTLPQLPEVYTKPSLGYLSSIISGIKLNFGDLTNEITEIFLSLNGVKGNYNKKEMDVSNSMSVPQYFFALFFF